MRIEKLEKLYNGTAQTESYQRNYCSRFEFYFCRLLNSVYTNKVALCQCFSKACDMLFRIDVYSFYSKTTKHR